MVKIPLGARRRYAPMRFHHLFPEPRAPHQNDQIIHDLAASGAAFTAACVHRARSVCASSFLCVCAQIASICSSHLSLRPPFSLSSSQESFITLSSSSSDIGRIFHRTHFQVVPVLFFFDLVCPFFSTRNFNPLVAADHRRTGARPMPPRLGRTRAAAKGGRRPPRVVSPAQVHRLRASRV